MHLFAKNSRVIFVLYRLKDRGEMCGHAVRRRSELMQRYNEREVWINIIAINHL